MPIIFGRSTDTARRTGDSSGQGQNEVNDTSGSSGVNHSSSQPLDDTQGVHRAPDGMVIDADIADRRLDNLPVRGVKRAEALARVKTADVPQRKQQGPTCGLYALGMVMDFWHAKDATCAAPWVSDQDRGGKGTSYNHDPTTDERILDVAQKAGYTALGEMFTGRQLARTAAHFGYTASIHEDATLDDLYAVLDKGHPAVVAFDVDYRGEPGTSGGQRAHYAVIQGYFDHDGERYLVAKHGWAVQDDHVWRVEDFDASWKDLKSTDFYGTPGDGKMGPDSPGVKEPALLDLPDLGGGRAGIERSLATKIIEVVPEGQTPVGGEIVAPPDSLSGT